MKTKDHQDGEGHEIEGTLDLAANVYNGMILTVLKNLGKGKAATIHLVTFTPKPEIVELAGAIAQRAPLTGAGKEHTYGLPVSTTDDIYS